jgi:hypothetical protein
MYKYMIKMTITIHVLLPIYDVNAVYECNADNLLFLGSLYNVVIVLFK